MKKILFGALLLAVFANAQITQRSLLGNWAMVPVKASPSATLTLVNDTLNMTDDWKYTEISVYNINYPDYGPNKIHLEYKLLVRSSGEYRIENATNLRRYLKIFESEILDASDEEAAQSSLREVERTIRSEINAPAPVLSVTETELELQGANDNPNLKFTKPRKLPNSRLTTKPVPFFAPDGWRYPENAKELANFPIRLRNDPNLFTIVEADFNGDDLKDAVAYLINDETGQVALFLYLSQPDGTYTLDPYGSIDRNTLVENGVILAPAGEYTNISTRQKFTTDLDGFMIVIFGTAATLVYFDLETNNWQSVPVGRKF
ncbi:MAG: hypothetical protein LBC85_02875 [Fibromonadaceae bacterium]|jgi:hypothetical protein|nr:hypothetical protein [Fibromonadaceae bacterium]